MYVRLIYKCSQNEIFLTIKIIGYFVENTSFYIIRFSSIKYSLFLHLFRSGQLCPLRDIWQNLKMSLLVTMRDMLLIAKQMLNIL